MRPQRDLPGRERERLSEAHILPVPPLTRHRPEAYRTTPRYPERRIAGSADQAPAFSLQIARWAASTDSRASVDNPASASTAALALSPACSSSMTGVATKVHLPDAFFSAFTSSPGTRAPPPPIQREHASVGFYIDALRRDLLHNLIEDDRHRASLGLGSLGPATRACTGLSGFGGLAVRRPRTSPPKPLHERPPSVPDPGRMPVIRSPRHRPSLTRARPSSYRATPAPRRRHGTRALVWSRAATPGASSSGTQALSEVGRYWWIMDRGVGGRSHWKWRSAG